MRSIRPRSAIAVLALASVALAGLAVADDSRPAPAPAPLKPIAQPFLDALVGSWTTASKGTHDGKEMTGTGRSTWRREIGGTALVQDYEGSMPGPDGKPFTFNGHGVYKLSDDGKTVTLWWFCNMNPDVMKVSGPVTDSSLKLTGTSPMGGAVDLAFEKNGDGGFTFSMKEGSNVVRETYKAAK